MPHRGKGRGTRCSVLYRMPRMRTRCSIHGARCAPRTASGACTSRKAEWSSGKRAPRPYSCEQSTHGEGTMTQPWRMYPVKVDVIKGWLHDEFPVRAVSELQARFKACIEFKRRNPGVPEGTPLHVRVVGKPSLLPERKPKGRTRKAKPQMLLPFEFESAPKESPS